MPNLNKTTQLKRKFKSAKTEKLIQKHIDGVMGNVFAFLSSVEYLARNVSYLGEFGHHYLLEAIDGEEEVVLILASLDDQCIDFVTHEDVLLMLEQMQSIVNCMFVYTNGVKKELPC